MNELRADIAAARARCNDLLARADRLEDPEAAEISEQLREIVAGLETMSYWFDCAERRARDCTVTPAETRDEKVIHAPTLCAAEVRISKVDEYILLRLETADEQLWWRLTRENFVSLAEYLNDEARRVRGH